MARIVPVHSTRADVERMLGSGINECKCGYYLKDVNVFFEYSSGNCKTGGSGGWDVQTDTVLKIVVHQRPAPLFSDLEIDKTKFEKRYDGHIERIVSYVNDEEGLVIQVDEVSCLVMGFYYIPAAADKELRCP